MRHLDRTDIEALLPHRGVSLFLQSARLEENRAEGWACWQADHPMLPGHFPQKRIVPGVLLLEGAAQLGGLIAAPSRESGQRLGLLAAVRRALFHAPLFPGQLLAYEAATKRHGDFITVRAEARHGPRKIVTCELILTEGPEQMQTEIPAGT